MKILVPAVIRRLVQFVPEKVEQMSPIILREEGPLVRQFARNATQKETPVLRYSPQSQLAQRPYYGSVLDAGLLGQFAQRGIFRLFKVLQRSFDLLCAGLGMAESQDLQSFTSPQ